MLTPKGILERRKVIDEEMRQVTRKIREEEDRRQKRKKNEEDENARQQQDGVMDTQHSPTVISSILCGLGLVTFLKS